MINYIFWKIHNILNLIYYEQYKNNKLVHSFYEFFYSYPYNNYININKMEKNISSRHL
jgi:hypothetical protein